MPITATVTTASTVSEAKLKDALIPPEIAHDPIILQLTWAVAIVTLIVTLGKPIKDYLKGEKKEAKADMVDDARNTAETVLYEHLSSQVTQYREIADQAFRERNDLIGRVAALESKAEDLAEQKVLVEKLKEKLDKKDEEIHLLLAQSAEERKQFLAILSSKESEIAKRDERILALERDWHDLELRLATSEKAIGSFVCPIERNRRSTDVATAGND